jgi:hypothetical protein
MKKFTDKINESVDGNNLPTADEFFDSANIGISSNTEYMYCKKDVVKKAIEFAKMHVEAALKEASEKATVYADEGGYSEFVDEQSILNAYTLDNIK